MFHPGVINSLSKNANISVYVPRSHRGNDVFVKSNIVATLIVPLTECNLVTFRLPCVSRPFLHPRWNCTAGKEITLHPPLGTRTSAIIFPLGKQFQPSEREWATWATTITTSDEPENTSNLLRVKTLWLWGEKTKLSSNSSPAPTSTSGICDVFE